jgi:hypothetical protein
MARDDDRPRERAGSGARTERRVSDVAEKSRNIGRRLREIRTWRGLSQQTVAELAGLSKACAELAAEEEAHRLGHRLPDH